VRLLLDEMFSPLMAEQLRSRGHDVESIKGTGHERLSDSDVLDLGAWVANSTQRLKDGLGWN